MTFRSGFDRARLNCERLEERETPSSGTWELQPFDSIPVGSIPNNWRQWADGGSFAVTGSRSQSAGRSLASTANSNQSSRIWTGQVMPADFGVSAYVYLDSLQPIQLMIRGRNLNTASPTYYALSLNRGLQAQLLKVVNGVSTSLGGVQSKSYFSGNWVRVAFRPNGSQLSVEIYRPDIKQYLNSAGLWQSSITNAMSIGDRSILGDGDIGLNRPAQYASNINIDDFSILGPLVQESFDSTPLGQLPGGWSSWTTNSSAAFQTSGDISFSPARALASATATSTPAARTWFATVLPADTQVSAEILLNSLQPVKLLARGQNLGTSTPTYYAVSITRGLEVKLQRVVKGGVTELRRVKSNSYFSNQWAKVSLVTSGDRVEAIVYRTDSGQYLDSNGNWSNTLARALDVTDDAIAGSGFVGVERPSQYSGTVILDDFEAGPATGDSGAPSVSILSPANGAELSGVVNIQADAGDPKGVEHVEFLVDGKLRYITTKAPYSWTFDTAGLANGTHTVTVKAYDSAANVGSASISIRTENSSPTKPSIPRHYTHIRVASLAYSGTPIDAFANTLLQNSIDLVIPHPKYLSQINSVAPNTPQLIYTNVSNIYEGLLSDWLTYADQHGVNRELAFFHAATPTAWSGSSASSIPVKYFWSVRRGASLSNLTNLTSAAQNSTPGDVAFGAAGESLYVGFVEQFREMNFDLSRFASGGWSGVLEYASTVDAAGNPSAWKTLSMLSDGTQGFSRSGTIQFDPPGDWATARIAGTAPLYYVRIRTTAGGTAPIASTIFGRNYVNAAGSPVSGIIPVFDSAADANHDGYLNDAEFANHASGKNARFLYESRVFYPYYGQMRFVTNPSAVEVRSWASDYQYRFLAANPLADGLFVDNSGGRSPLGTIQTIESPANYGQDYASMLAAINTKIAPRWVAANTAGGGSDADSVIRNTPASVEEFALRPLASTYSQFEDEAALIAHRLALQNPSAYLILDSLPTGGATTDPRTQLATLAYYYLVADPNNTFLMFYGGYDPNSSWINHWSPAAAYNVGQPTGDFSLFAQGSDPCNLSLTYKIYQRDYGNALVLYKPLSYKPGVGTGTLSNATATTHQLNGTYRILNANGTLSGPVTSVTLRNGEGAVLIKS